MKVQNQVCTLQQSKRFKELGVLQLSCFGYSGLHGILKCALSVKYMPEQWEFFTAAFTVAELGAMVGKGTHCAEMHWEWLQSVVNGGNSGTKAYDASSLASFLITAIVNGWTTVTEVNTRLQNA